MKISLATQLKLGLLLPMLFVIVLGIVSYIQSNKHFQETESLYNHALILERSISMLKTSIISLHRDMKDISIDSTKNEIDIELAWIKWWGQRASGQIDTIYREYTGKPSDIDSLKHEYFVLNSLCEKTIELMRADKRGEVLNRTKTNGVISVSVKNLLDKLDEINLFTINKDDKLYLNLVQLRNSLNKKMLLLVILIFLFSLIINFILTRNISERKTTEEALYQSYIFNDSLLKTIPFGMEIVDLTGTVLFQSENFIKLFGDRAIGKKCWEFYKDDKLQCIDCPLLRGITVGETNSLQAHGILGNRIFEISHSGMIYEGKQAMLEIFQDITERIEKEVELIKAKEKAEESDRLKSAFLANVSHEIRTPMNGILGFSELLKEPDLSTDDRQDFIQTIQISGARMLSTINSIIDMSKIESRIMKVDIKKTNINEKIEFAYKFFKPEVEIKRLQFFCKTSLPSSEVTINTDNEKVYSILTNLIKNAIKFTFEGSIEFGYVLKSDSEPAVLEFFVKDTGVGIPEDQKEVIFERFRQGSESQNRIYEGSGLGLSICKSYVEMLGGKIWLESKENKGSTFYFTIPYNPVPEAKSVIETAISEEFTEGRSKKLKILIVEDDEVSYSLLTRMLRNISNEVIHAKTGVRAVEECHNNPDLDLVLMDIRMPVMDGNEATRQIRRFNKNVIIIAQTAYASTGEIEKAIDAGCNNYITKPIRMTLLLELIKKYFSK
jgi:signal transduction histidine kinase/CheY-like chemotaxis protein